MEMPSPNKRITGTLHLESGKVVYMNIFLDGTFMCRRTVYSGGNEHVAHDIMSAEIELLPGSSIAVECQYSQNA
jgi:hypothetical protein